jgi:lysophospholipase L1-like esterase
VTGYSRYVAIGDSQTEGLWDPDGNGGVIGFADRLAAHLDILYPGLGYANLAVRGRRIAHLLERQLPPALSMRPDLITICIGMNDVTRPGRLFGAALADLEAVYATLAVSGATVVTTVFPDITGCSPPRPPKPSACPAVTTAGRPPGQAPYRPRSGPAQPRRCPGRATCSSPTCGETCAACPAATGSRPGGRYWRR